jgi:hypothetical protein
MGNVDPMKRLLLERRRRCVATVLGFCEASDWWDELERDEQRELRTTVLNAIGGLHDVFLDILKVLDDGSVRNTLAVDAIDAVNPG